MSIRPADALRAGICAECMNAVDIACPGCARGKCCGHVPGCRYTRQTAPQNECRGNGAKAAREPHKLENAGCNSRSCNQSIGGLPMTQGGR